MARPWERPCNLDSGGPCRNDGLIQQHWSLAEARTATYVYGEEGLIAEYQAQGSNAAQLAAQYGWQPEGTWGTDPVWIKTTPAGGSQAGYFYYQNDHLGTPQKIIDGQGQSVWSQKSTAFGETTVDAASALVNNLRFPGQYFDAETDLHYNGFRDYDPGVGRYVESDPIALKGGINTYAYVENNPLSFIDPDGLVRDGRPTKGRPGRGRPTDNDPLWPALPKTDDCNWEELSYCDNFCAQQGKVSVGCYVSIRWKLNGIRENGTPDREAIRIPNCSCEKKQCP